MDEKPSHPELTFQLTFQLLYVNVKHQKICVLPSVIYKNALKKVIPGINLRERKEFKEVG